MKKLDRSSHHVNMLWDIFLYLEAVANADEMLGEIFLEEREPTIPELKVS